MPGALLSFGQSSIHAHGSAAGGSGWRIALRDARGGFASVIELRDAALSVSESLGQQMDLFIYLFEGKEPFSERTAELRRRMLERGDQLFTSTLTLGEVLVKSFETRSDELAATYR